jgi:organic hydroperoxide reductase OsmC/OhrA
MPVLTTVFNAVPTTPNTKGAARVRAKPPTRAPPLKEKSVPGSFMYYLLSACYMIIYNLVYAVIACQVATDKINGEGIGIVEY